MRAKQLQEEAEAGTAVVVAVVSKFITPPNDFYYTLPLRLRPLTNFLCNYSFVLYLSVSFVTLFYDRNKR